MGFKVGAFAKIWTDPVEADSKKTCKARLSITHKNKTTDQFEQDFGDYVLFIGPAKDKAMSLHPGSRIRIEECDVSNKYDKDKGVKYVTYKIFNFSEEGSESHTHTDSSTNKQVDVEAGPNEDELPF